GNSSAASSITDRNGNQITINRSYNPNTNHYTTEYIDQAGRPTTIEQPATDPANASVTLAALVTIKGYQGTPRYYKIKTDAVGNHIRADFNYNHQPIITGANDPFGFCYQGGQPPAANYIFPDSYCQHQWRVDNRHEISEVQLPNNRSV